MTQKIGILCDSTCSIPEDLQKQYDITVIPLTVVRNGQDYLDGKTIHFDDVNEAIRNKEPLQTSQPSIGLSMQYLEAMHQKYETIIVLTLSSHLSGTYSSVSKAIEELSYDNVYIVDSYTLAGPIESACQLIRHHEEKNLPVQTIIENVKTLFTTTESFVYPENLDRLKLSGRISTAAATMASLLKIKPLLHLANAGVSIEKYATARTEAKIFDLISKKMREANVTPDTHHLYYLENCGIETLERLKEYVTTTFGHFEDSVRVLPPVISTHAGIGTVALQWVAKVG